MIVVALCLAITSCTGATGESRDPNRLLVVTTVAPITSITSSVVGDLADVEGIVPEGTNSHTYEPPPSVAALLADADVVVLNGLALEEPIKGYCCIEVGRPTRSTRGAEICEVKCYE